MTPSRIAVLLLFLLALPARPQHKSKKPALPAVFDQARFVYVEAVDGQEFDPGLNPDDRQAIADVRDAVRQWNRYTLAARREDADLVIVVRKGRAIEGKVGVILGSTTGPPGNPSRGQNGTGVGVVGGGEAGTPDDLFEICQLNPNGMLSTPLWMRTFPDGLDGPKVMLFEQFKEAVEKAYPVKPAQQPGNQAPTP